MRRIVITLLICSFLGSIYATNRALLIGIGKYKTGTQWSEIHGDADVDLLKPLLEKKGFEVTTLKNDEATKQGIVAALNQLIKECNKGDNVYFHFSGHGQPMEDLNGDEETFYDQTMVPYDAVIYYEEGEYEGENHFLDDEYSYYINSLRNKLGDSGRLFIAIDACHSEGMQRGDSDTVVVRGTDYTFRFNGKKPDRKFKVPVTLSSGASTVIVSACGKEEVNYEYRTSSGKMFGSLTCYMSYLMQSEINFDKWQNSFLSREYKRTKYFRRQNPTIEEF
jgi:hypothetical protein